MTFCFYSFALLRIGFRYMYIVNFFCLLCSERYIGFTSLYFPACCLLCCASDCILSFFIYLLYCIHIDYTTSGQAHPYFLFFYDSMFPSLLPGANLLYNRCIISKYSLQTSSPNVYRQKFTYVTPHCACLRHNLPIRRSRSGRPPRTRPLDDLGRHDASGHAEFGSGEGILAKYKYRK